MLCQRGGVSFRYTFNSLELDCLCSFDVEMPLEVDDEYWIDDDPQLAFRQPSGKPSLVSAFNYFIKLSRMMAFTIRTIVSREQNRCKYLNAP